MVRPSNRKFRKDLQIQDAVMHDLYKTNHYRNFSIKYWDDRKPQDYRMNRFTVDDANVRSLHEQCMKNPIMPMKTHQTTTADHYEIQKEIRVSSSVPKKSPVEESTCPIQALGRDEFPSIPINSPGYCKHLDIFVSTSQLAHPCFTLDQQNGVARKDIRTFYDTSGVPKCRGFGPKNAMPIGDYFHRDKTEPDRIRMRTFCRVPRFGKTSEYREKFDHVLTNLMHRHEEVPFPPIFRADKYDTLSVPAMYCTENCHIGTGWPVNATVHIANKK